MDSRFPTEIQRQACEACESQTQPTYGAGQTEVCKRCVEMFRHKQDVAIKIADKVERMCIPSDIMDDELRDLIKLYRWQHG